MPVALLAVLSLACRPPEGAGPAIPGGGTPPPDSGEAADSAEDTGDTAPPVDGATCGDGAVGPAGEECDGGDDAACPGRCSSACACPSLEPTGELALYVLDVGQGDGMLLVSPDGFTMLVDAGDSTYEDAVEAWLLAQGFPALDFVLASHLHGDHMGGMDAVLRRHPEVQFALDAGGIYGSDAYDAYVLAAGDRRRTVAAGDRIDLGPAMDVEVLHADVGDRDNENNNSVVLRLTYGDVRVLLGGDCEYPVCEGAFDPGPVDVYKVHHHGASDASSPGLLDAMRPSTAIIPVGARNDYGHPHASTLRELARVGATVWRTDEDGDVVVRIDGAGWTVNGVEGG